MTSPVSPSVTATQRAAILEALRHGPLNTIAARERLGIASPAVRVLELRRLGYYIRTQRKTVADAEGRLHRVANYSLGSASGG